MDRITARPAMPGLNLTVPLSRSGCRGNRSLLSYDLRHRAQR